MNKLFFIIPLLSFSFLPSYADFHDEMVEFMPNVRNFDDNWKFTQIQGFKNLELDWTSEKPDGLTQRFVFTDETDKTEMVITVSIYEFQSSQASKNIFEEYVSILVDNDYPKAPLETSLQEDCFATRINEGKNNEKTSVACHNSEYVIISTSEQSGGDVFSEDQQLTTVIAANGFANMIYEKIENFNNNIIPEWIKNNAGWWADGQIDDDSFIQGIQFMIKEGIITIPPVTESSQETNTSEIPEWIKNNAGWWANGEISDDSFIKGIQYLIQHGIIQVDTSALQSKPAI